MNSTDLELIVNRLEATEATLHSGAFSDCRDALRLLRSFSDAGKIPSSMSLDDVMQIPDRLRRSAQTISNPARERFINAAATIEELFKK
jgi:hypothetical protein